MTSLLTPWVALRKLEVEEEEEEEAEEEENSGRECQFFRDFPDLPLLEPSDRC
jgi:hypothetical protein